MRVALLSDIHGNQVALTAVLADMRRHGPYDQTVVVGDLAWDGPWPAEVVDSVRGLKGAVIQGNTDRYFLHAPDDPPEGKNPPAFTAERAWLGERLGPERVSYLCNLPFSHRISPPGGRDLLIVHATPASIDQYLTPQMDTPELDAILGPEEGCNWGAVAFGHLHIPFVKRWRGRQLIDVASAGLPKDGDQRAVYTLLTWNGVEWIVEHHRVMYQVPVVAYEMRTCGLPGGDHYAARLVRATY